MNEKKKANVFLWITAFIWGTAFIAQQSAMEHIGPFAFISLRFFLAGIAIFSFYFIYSKKKSGAQHIVSFSQLIKHGIICGFILFVASSFQQFGINYTTVGKTAFITSLYIVLIPVLGIVFKNKTTIFTWIAVLVGAMGLYFLSIKKGFTIQSGDLIVLIGAFFWAIHVLTIDRFLAVSSAIPLAIVQFFTCSIFSFIAMLLIETISFSSIRAAGFSILYAGILSGGFGFTFQILGQRKIEPAVASLILSMESVFGALAGFILLGERMKARETWGAFLLLSAIVIAQLPDFFESKRKESKNEII